MNKNHPNREPISKSAVCKTLQRFHETGGVKDRQEGWRPVIVTSEENPLDAMVDRVENTTMSTQQLALDHRMSLLEWYSIQKISKRDGFRPYTIHLLQELTEDDFDSRIEDCFVK